MGTVLTRDALVAERKKLKAAGKKIVFTNGCFDIIHRGHVDYLTKARALGDALIVGVNSDASVRRLKGPSRPVVQEDDRAFVLAGLAAVDFACIFDEDTPYDLIKAVVPDILVKGGDWAIENVVGKDVVEAAGGSVQTISFVEGRSTTNIIKKISEQ
ncbi:MAG: D-glycero-beta-D-manno-heptose 1-phosphate adenylyltransferase [Bacteroidetes bacterium]|jgi:D-beta-D-heptose 7-phosphate kinase/D-beta-D-heptose 1-phosphate adenosyltransferase|nr:D-glycero-beta-D-manno-heptose 1-phosphate adenylyltransferase [Bacteroidota bacterium]